MSEIIFARPRHNYASYTDFWELVKLAKFPIIYQDEIDPTTENTYIFTGADAHVSFPEGKARVIYWLLEWYGDYVQKPGVTETWCSNVTFSDMLGLRYVPMGSHPGLGTIDRLPLKHDITHLSYSDVHRRRLLYDRFLLQGFSIAPNGWGNERDEVLRSTRLMIHVHQNGQFPGIAPLRLSLGAAYGLPVVAENGWSSEPYGNTIIHSAYRGFEQVVRRTLQNYSQIEYLGEQLHTLLCYDLEFGRVVRAHV